MKEEIQAALLLLPEHRKKFKKSKIQTLDDLIDDQRLLGKLNSSAFDFVMMSYRYYHVFQEELKLFLTKPLQPKLLEDLLALAFSAIISRREEQESGIVFWSVEVAKEKFGKPVAPLVNAFCRKIQKNKLQIQERVAKHPEIALGKELPLRWSQYPNLIHKTAQKLLDRPSPGIEGFNEDLKWARYSSDAIHMSKFQAMNYTSWLFVDKIIDLVSGSPFVKNVINVLDACASPGAKIIAFTMKAKEKNLKLNIQCTEAKFKRLERLEENIKRWNLTECVSSKLFSWGEGKTWRGDPYDIIFADLPCSGSGTIAERPDLLLRDFSKDIDALSKIQIKILEELIYHLKPNAYLVVSICSIDPIEIDLISQALNTQPTFDTRNHKDWFFEELVGWFFQKN